MGLRSRITTALFTTMLALTASAVTDDAYADGKGREYAYAQPVSYNLDDYGVARVNDVIAKVHDLTDGRVIKIKLETKKRPSRWKYKTKVLRDDGRIVKIEHHAQTLTVLEFKLKH